MNIGFHLRGRDLAESVANARRLEAAGIESAWVGDSALDAFVHVAAVAANTKTIELGTAVTLLTRSPVVAMLAASGLDEISNGRFTLGLGVGPDDWNRDWHGVDPAKPARRMREYIQCFKAAWHSGPGNPAQVDGEIFSINGFQRMRRSPSDELKLLVGVVGPMNTRNAAEFGDGVIYDIVLPHSHLKDVGTPALNEGMRRGGKSRRDLSVGGLFAVSIDRDRSSARRRARNSILLHIPVHYYVPVFESCGFGVEALASRRALERGDVEAALDAISDEMVEELTLAGTPDEVLRRVDEWSDVVDFMIVAAPSHGLEPDEAAWAYDQAIECFGK